MVRRIALYAVLLAALAATSATWMWLRRDHPNARPVAQAPRRALPAQHAAPPSRLPPDSRFLVAVGDVHELLRHAGHSPAVADFEGGAWRVRHGGVEVGVLPEFPGFGDLRRLLSQWALSLGARDSLVSPERPACYPDVDARLAALQALPAADCADRLWATGLRDPGLLERGARALALLAVESGDQVDASERLAARSLALTAVCAAADSSAVVGEECLLANTMGYGAEAWTLAERLAPDDPVRLLVRCDDAALARYPIGAPRGREARYFALLRQAERRDIEGWAEALADSLGRDRALTLPLIATGFALHRFEADVPTAAGVLAAVDEDLRLNRLDGRSSASVPERQPVGHLVERFETMMEAMRPESDGSLLDREVLRSYYRACFYSALRGIGEHLRRALSTVEGTRDFAIALGDGANRQGPGPEFQRWFTHLAQAKQGHADREGLLSDLGASCAFGGAMALTTQAVIAEGATVGDPVLAQSAHAVAARLDTRPAHLVRYGRILHTDVLDLARADVFLARGVAGGHPLDLALRGWWALYNCDQSALEHLAGSPGLSPELRATALQSLGALLPGDWAPIRAAYRQCIASRPADWDLTHAYVEYLRERRSWKEMRAVSERWLARADRSDRAFDEIFARIAIAEALQHEGQPGRALAAIAPVVDSWQFGAMEQGAEALAGLGRTAEAETLAMAAWQRYPDSAEAEALAVGLLWRSGDFAGAAAALRDAPRPMTFEEWRWALGPRFVACFARDPGGLRQAADALAKAGMGGGTTLGMLARALADSGFDAPAFAVSAREQDAGQDELYRRVNAYGYLKAARGEREALEWLRPLLPRDTVALELMSYVAFDLEEDELVWRLSAAEGLAPRDEFLWLLRAAAALRTPTVMSGHRDTLLAHLARPNGERYQLLGRYLLGHETEDAVRATMTTPKATCEGLFYLGFRADCAGDYVRAADRYARCLETRQARNGEFGWSLARLRTWSTQWKSLEALAREHRAKQAPRAPTGAGGAGAGHAKAAGTT